LEFVVLRVVFSGIVFAQCSARLLVVVNTGHTCKKGKFMPELELMKPATRTYKPQHTFERANLDLAKRK